MKVERKVFDAHFHIGIWGKQVYYDHAVQPFHMPTTQGYFPGTEHEDGQNCVRYFETYDLAGGVVMPNFLAADPPYSLITLNEKMYAGVDKVPQLYGAIFVSPLYSDMEFSREALKSFRHPKIRAMKFTSTTWAPQTIDPITWTPTFRANMEELLDYARECKLVLHFHTGCQNSEPRFFDQFLRTYGENLTIQFVHSGETVVISLQFVPLFLGWLEEGFDVYCDSALCPGFVVPWLMDQLKRIPNGDDRVLFATDAPWGVLPAEYYKIECLALSEEQKNKIFFDNAARIYRLCDDAVG